MSPEALQRALIRAVAFGDQASEHRLRQRLRGLAHASAADYLHATALVCLTYRFGPPEPDPSGPTSPTSPVGPTGPIAPAHPTRINHANLERTSLRHALIDGTALDHEALGASFLDDHELGRFMAELRAAGPAFRPPSNFLEVEAMIRGLYGEPHMFEEIGAKQQHEALAFVLRYLTDSTPDIRNDFETIIDQAQSIQRRWLTG